MATEEDREAAGGLFDPTVFSLSGMLRCGTRLRRVAESAPNLPAAANAVVDELYDGFLDRTTGRPAFVLARMFVLRPFARLDPELAAYVRGRLGGRPCPADLPCLTLLATRGDLPQWCDPRRSVDHRAIPVPDRRTLECTPMIAALVDDLGMEPEMVAYARPSAREQAHFGLCHVADAADAGELLDRSFVRNHHVQSVLGFGGLLASGEVFAVVLFSRTPILAETARLFRTVAVHARLGLLSQERGAEPEATHLGSEIAALRELLHVHEATAAEQAESLERTLDERSAAERRARDETNITETLYEIGTALSAELEPDRVVQLALNAGRRVTGAMYGVFFRRLDARHATFSSTQGAAAELAGHVPAPATVAQQGARDTPVLRSDDLARDAEDPNQPVRSYLAAPVLSRTGAVLGAFAFGHRERGVFRERHERLAIGIASQTAIAIDNARLYREQREAAVELQRSLLPEFPAVADLHVVSRYLPAAPGFDVGGDWFDLIPIDDDHTALVVGDVMGRGLQAAALMGQLRTAIRAYTVIGLSPGVVMYHLNQLMETIPGDQVATCLYAIYDSRTHTLRFSNAGHPPPLLVRRGGEASFAGDRLGPLLSGLNTGRYRERQLAFDPDSGLLLYTDGLVESRTRTVTEGMDELAARVRKLLAAADLDQESTWNALIDDLVQLGSHDDDIAVLYARPRRPA